MTNVVLLYTCLFVAGCRLTLECASVSISAVWPVLKSVIHLIDEPGSRSERDYTFNIFVAFMIQVGIHLGADIYFVGSLFSLSAILLAKIVILQAVLLSSISNGLYDYISLNEMINSFYGNHMLVIVDACKAESLFVIVEALKVDSLQKLYSSLEPILIGALLVTLEEGVATLGELIFTDNFSWIRSRKFRLGLKIASSCCENIHVREANIVSFILKDHRGELYKNGVFDLSFVELIGKESRQYVYRYPEHFGHFGLRFMNMVFIPINILLQGILVPIKSLNIVCKMVVVCHQGLYFAIDDYIVEYILPPEIVLGRIYSVTDLSSYLTCARFVLIFYYEMYSMNGLYEGHVPQLRGNVVVISVILDEFGIPTITLLS